MKKYCDGCHKEKTIVNITTHNERFCEDCMGKIPKKLWFLPTKYLMVVA